MGRGKCLIWMLHHIHTWSFGIFRELENKDALSKSDPFCVFFMKNTFTREMKEIGRTETIKDTLNPTWTKTFLVDYHMEERQVTTYLHIKLFLKCLNTIDDKKWSNLSLFPPFHIFMDLIHVHSVFRVLDQPLIHKWPPNSNDPLIFGRSKWPPNLIFFLNMHELWSNIMLDWNTKKFQLFHCYTVSSGFSNPPNDLNPP